MAATRLGDGVWIYQGVTASARSVVLAHHLTGILGCDAARIRLERDQTTGKPFLASPVSDLVFSVSHRQQAMLLAIGRGEAVGCDLETQAGEDVATLDEALVRQFFSKGERDWFEGLDARARRVAFRKLWTGKEAVLKADGIGLAGGAVEPDFAPFLCAGEDLPDGLSGLVVGGKTYAVQWFAVASRDGSLLAAVARPKSSPLFLKEDFVNASVSGIT